ncbi:MAG: hypothetical protein H7301_12710 [Cryobacterium sp.]|nr:hypothetical protein [Oligoflexia bacterium]
MNGKTTSPSLSIDLTEFRSSLTENNLLGSGSVAGVLGLSGLAPASALDFPCYGINVTGPGIADTSPHPDGDAQNLFDSAIARNTTCGYRGILSAPIRLSSRIAEANLPVSPGRVRLVQFVGVSDSTVCASGLLGGGASSTNGNHTYYELGRAVLRDFYSDVSVAITTNWPTNVLARETRAVDCGDSGIPTSPTATLNSLTIGPTGTSNYSVSATGASAAHSVTLTVTGHFSDGSSANVTNLVTWSPNVTTNFSITTAGVLTGLVYSGGSATALYASYTVPGGSSISSTPVNVTVTL